MHDPLEHIRSKLHSLADAIRWACLLEATAPKVGNVYPGQPFQSLNYEHFVQAAEITSTELTRFSIRTTQRILNCVEETKRVTGTNVNLGIILLMAPMIESMQSNRDVSDIFMDWDEVDGQFVFDAIRISNAGGLERVDVMDVHSRNTNVDILAAMKSAASVDRIAKQYDDGFEDLMANVVPVLESSIQSTGDVLSGICNAHFRLLASSPDSLIARKNGLSVAMNVQQRGAMIDPDDADAMDNFDQFLRSDGNQLNPGTTADLIAAGLLVLLSR